MRHTLDEASMLEILAAAKSDTRPRAGPHSAEMSAGRRAHKTRPTGQLRAGSEQEPVPDAGGDEPGHGEQQIRWTSRFGSPEPGPAAGLQGGPASVRACERVNGCDAGIRGSLCHL
jgi:hypothetical protein